MSSDVVVDPWYCPIHMTHHVVPSLVQDCIRRATDPEPTEETGV